MGKPRACCVDATGAPLPPHLCCPACRAVMAAAERARLIAAGTAPAGCSAEIPVAPARGSLAAFSKTVMIPKGAGWSEAEAPYRAGRPGRVRDVFDTMTEQATRRGGPPPFTGPQVDTARAFRDLVERLEAAGVKCSRAFDAELRGGDGAGFMDAYIADRQRLARFGRAIGDGLALSPRRQSAHGFDRGQRRAIPDATLVQLVCIAQQPLSAVLRAHGWTPTGKARKALQEALTAILGRMQGI